jgi:hypothetical protein
MKNTPLQSIIDDSFDRMFIVDQHGKIVFFPWGGKRQGYMLKSRSLVARVKKFYRSSLFICFVICVITASLLHNNLGGIVGSLLISSGGWCLSYYLYTTKIVKSLPTVKASYNEIVLNKLELVDNKELSQADIQFPAHWNRPAQHREWPGQVLMACFFVGTFTGLIWSMYRPEHWVDADHFIGSLVSFLLGYGFFVVAQNMEAAKEDWFAFRQWKLSVIMLVVAAWSLAAWLLYKFVVVIFT